MVPDPRIVPGRFTTGCSLGTDRCLPQHV